MSEFFTSLIRRGSGQKSSIVPQIFRDRGLESLRRRMQRGSQTVLRIDIALPLCLHRMNMRCPPFMRAAVPIAIARISTAISTGAGG
jgi:hypothetical protein